MTVSATRNGIGAAPSTADEGEGLRTKSPMRIEMTRCHCPIFIAAADISAAER